MDVVCSCSLHARFVDGALQLRLLVLLVMHVGPHTSVSTITPIDDSESRYGSDVPAMLSETRVVS